MSDLERRREAKDLWISRGHIFSAGVGVSLLLVVAFALGYRMGSAENDPQVLNPTLEVAEHDRQLQELLERLDALQDPTAVDALTFPELKKGSEAQQIAVPGPADGGVSVAIAMSDHAVPGELSNRVGPMPDGRHVEWLRTSDVGEVRRAIEWLAQAAMDTTLVVEKSPEQTLYTLVSTPCESISDCDAWQQQNSALVGHFDSFSIRPPHGGSQ
jgi:hypothetical protein